MCLNIIVVVIILVRNPLHMYHILQTYNCSELVFETVRFQFLRATAYML